MFGNSKKKLVIKPYAPAVQNKDKAEIIWESLAVAIQKIFTLDVGSLSFNELYGKCYDIVLLKNQEMLYNGIKNQISIYLENELLKLRILNVDSLLQSISDLYDNFTLSVSRVSGIAMYLESDYIKTRQKLTIEKLGLVVFREKILQDVSVSTNVQQVLLQLIQNDRNGSIVDKGLIRKTLDILLSVSIHEKLNKNTYRDEFETPFLKETQKYYSNETSKLMDLLSGEESLAMEDPLVQALLDSNEQNEYNICSVFLKQAETRIKQENNRVDSYILRTSEEKLRRVVNTCWIDDYAEDLLTIPKKGFKCLIEKHCISDLKRLYQLFRRPGEHTAEMLKAHFGGYVRNTITEILDQSSDKNVTSSSNKVDKTPSHVSNSHKRIIDLLDFRNSVKDVIERAFLNNKMYTKMVKDIFEEIFNSDMKYMLYFINYIDDVLKNNVHNLHTASCHAIDNHGVKLDKDAIRKCNTLVLDDKDGETLISHIMSLFKYIQDKDIFENHYKASLSKRLLNNKSVSEEWEKVFLSKLKAECGYQYTARMEGMLNDMTLSKQVMDQFRLQLPTTADKSNSCVELDATILTSGNWPITTPSAAICYPSNIVSVMDSFSTYYTDRHGGKRLTWLSHLGTADVKVTFRPKVVKDFNVSTYQMIILMMFATENTVTLKEMEESSNIKDTAELKRHVLSLCTPKAKLLIKSSKGKHISDTESFTLNVDFDSKLRRIKVPLVSTKEVDTSTEGSGTLNNAKGRDAIPEAVEETRRLAVEAAIVRILKARKSIEHNELIAEVTKQLVSRFFCAPIVIKKRIESLIERDYLARDENEFKLYHYLA